MINSSNSNPAVMGQEMGTITSVQPALPHLLTNIKKLNEYQTQEEAALVERQTCLEIVDYYRTLYMPKAGDSEAETATTTNANTTISEATKLSIYTQALLDNLAERIAAGKHLTSIERAKLAQSDGMIGCEGCNHRMHVPTQCTAQLDPAGNSSGYSSLTSLLENQQPPSEPKRCECAFDVD